MSLTVVKNATCTFCGCVCDDIELHADGERITKTKNACILGEAWFRNHTAERLFPDALIDGQSRLRDRLWIYGLALDQRPQRGQNLKILARPNLKKNVRRLRAGCFTNVDQDHRSILTAVRDELSLLGERVFGEMPWMAFRRIASPVDDEVRSVLDFA